MKSRFLFAFLVPFLAGCAPSFPSFECENDISQTIKSPDGAHVIVVFSRGCGATTSESTQVSLLPSTSTLGTETGNVLDFPSEETVTVHWKDEKTVEISYSQKAGQPWKQSSVDGVRFDYKISKDRTKTKPATRKSGGF